MAWEVVKRNEKKKRENESRKQKKAKHLACFGRKKNQKGGIRSREGWLNCSFIDHD